MATNQGFKSFILTPDKLNPGYLYHWLRANGAYLESLGSGATFKEVSKAVVPRIKLPLPSLGEQAVAGAAEGASAEGAARNTGGQDTAAASGGAKPH
jgi:type I restriction enzyme S subunit